MLSTMLWRVRANLPNRPGALAALAHECGKAGVNIDGVQVFPGQERVTDELVLRTSEEWQAGDLVALVERAGADSVVALPCGEGALDDQPTRYVRAAKKVLDEPETFPEVVAHLFDADVAPTGGVEDVLELTVGNAVVQIRRATPFTPTERERGSAMAELVTDVLARQGPPAPPTSAGDVEPEYVSEGRTVSALVNGLVAGRGDYVVGEGAEPWPVDLWVDPAWQRRGIGTRLLAEVVRRARSAGADEVVLTAPAETRAVLPMVLAAGLRGRIRMAGETVTIRISLSDLRA
ncbi:GNAT superfamily N-acetyltransferase [Nocardioides thalensis]|uniref:GNAT superfamily N-acetyltransferase n=1 Tax=Nocardioides thalensis TaxID=1914755 RepID=A0A853C665_9ACTN|nr:GNAT family N-acetyltransferase [Nocardioides thalensis]NYJ02641.1 GNAT superfamily N-acetyltransferase [Nocardioides thalensis]